MIIKYLRKYFKIKTSDKPLKLSFLLEVYPPTFVLSNNLIDLKSPAHGQEREN